MRLTRECRAKTQKLNPDSNESGFFFVFDFHVIKYFQKNIRKSFGKTILHLSHDYKRTESQNKIRCEN